MMNSQHLQLNSLPFLLHLVAAAIHKVHTIASSLYVSNTTLHF